MLTLTPALPVSTGFADARTFLEMIKDIKKFEKAIAEFEDHYLVSVTAKAKADKAITEAYNAHKDVVAARTEAEAVLTRAKAARIEIQNGFEKLEQERAALVIEARQNEDEWQKNIAARALIAEDKKRIEAEQAATTEGILDREKNLDAREAVFNAKIEAAKAFLGAAH